MTAPDAADAWTPLDDLLALHSADDVEEFRRRLVVYPSALTKKSDAFEPWCLFHRYHKDDPEGAATTAVLLVTDRRWRNATGRLIRHIDESGFIPPDDLDVLAQTFLAAGPQVYWEVPGKWFDGPAITIDPRQQAVNNDSDDDEEEEEEPEDSSEDGPVVVAREVRPPLRRWAATRIVLADPGLWGQLLNRARDLDPRGGAAIMRGVLDGVDGLTPAARAVVVKLATEWPQRDVREAVAHMVPGHEPGREAPPIAPAARSTLPGNAAQSSLF